VTSGVRLVVASAPAPATPKAAAATEVATACELSVPNSWALTATPPGVVTVVPLTYAWTELLSELPAREAPTETPIRAPAREPVPTRAFSVFVSVAVRDTSPPAEAVPPWR
jgi:hypothetical protein